MEGRIVSAEPDETATILLNGTAIASIPVDEKNGQAAAEPGARGFTFMFPEPLTAADSVAVHAKDGTLLRFGAFCDYPERLRRLFLGIDLENQNGLEFGALDRPLLSRKRYAVSNVDHTTREGLAAKYKSAPASNVNIEKLYPVDFVWNGETSLSEAVNGQTFGFAVSSHVIEHVADPISWLGEIAAVLHPGGRLNFAVPEKTQTFDFRRTETTPAQLLADYEARLKIPSFAQIFDHIIYAAPLGSNDPPHPSINAYTVARHNVANRIYTDVHCHVWTVTSWNECWRVIDDLGLLPLKMEAVFEPLPGTNEFIVSLVKQ